MHDERWKTLCEKASTEQDPQKLLELVKEITDLLDQKHERPAVTRLEPSRSSGDRESN